MTIPDRSLNARALAGTSGNARVLAARTWGDFAVVAVIENEPGPLHYRVELLMRRHEGWESLTYGGSFGAETVAWWSVEDLGLKGAPAPGIGVYFRRLPDKSREALVRSGTRLYREPVAEGYVLCVGWGVTDDSWHPRLDAT